MTVGWQQEANMSCMQVWQGRMRYTGAVTGRLKIQRSTIAAITVIISCIKKSQTEIGGRLRLKWWLTRSGPEHRLTRRSTDISRRPLTLMRVWTSPKMHLFLPAAHRPKDSEKSRLLHLVIRAVIRLRGKKFISHGS